MKLYANLHNSVELVLDEGYRIIKRYKKLDFYIEKIAFDKKKLITKNNKQKNTGLKILQDKQRELMPNMQNQKRHYSNQKAMFGGGGGTTLDFYNN